jgi:ribulose-5-phosphate 4-epimerase/fuculose-1-phosphate aldolase
MGFHEGIDNHFSLALTADGGEFLVNPYGRHFGELRARDLLRVDTAGRVLAGDGAVEPTALYIHGNIACTAQTARCAGASATPRPRRTPRDAL